VFTGAGISTSLGIPDYRSGTDTIVKTGPGLWNRELNPTKPH
jgi:NAD-dependent SIR2 family protein deacetylase